MGAHHGRAPRCVVHAAPGEECRLHLCTHTAGLSLCLAPGPGNIDQRSDPPTGRKQSPSPWRHVRRQSLHSERQLAKHPTPEPALRAVYVLSVLRTVDNYMDLLCEEDRPYFKAATDGRITCTLNGHTLPVHEEAVRAFTRCAARLCKFGGVPSPSFRPLYLA